MCLQGGELLSEGDLRRVAKPEELQWDLGGHREPSPSHWVETHQVSFLSHTQDTGSLFIFFHQCLSFSVYRSFEIGLFLGVLLFLLPW